MATQRSEHVRHLQWSRLAGLRRRERAGEGPDADEVSARRKRGVGSFGSFVAGVRRGGCEEGEAEAEAERAVRGIGKRKGMDGKVRYVGYVYPQSVGALPAGHLISSHPGRGLRLVHHQSSTFCQCRVPRYLLPVGDFLLCLLLCLTHTLFLTSGCQSVSSSATEPLLFFVQLLTPPSPLLSSPTGSNRRPPPFFSFSLNIICFLGS